MKHNTTRYRVAELLFELGEEHFFFRGLEPFRVTSDAAPTGDEEPILRLSYQEVCQPLAPTKQIDSFDFPDADADCRLERYPAGYLFTMQVRHSGQRIHFDIPDGTAEASCNFKAEDDPSLFRFGLWITFNIRAVAQGAVAIHSSVLTYRLGAVLCLGESGTGKSTHTRLWREHIEGAGLLNDDSPFVRITAGEARVYGSPWSGKTPCYRNLDYPIRGFMRLSQGPRNEIRSLGVLQAYGALQPSCPPSFMHDERLFDATNHLLSELLRRVKAWHLSCLPNVEAAELARDTIFPTEA